MSLFISVISLSVGYASLSSSLLVSGEAHLRVKEEVRVTNLTISEQISSSYDNNSEYYKNGLILRAVLPNKESKITYEVELTNNSSLDYYLKSAGYKSIEEDVYTEIDKNTMTFEKGDFKYTIEGIKTDDTVIKPDKSTFTITISYKDEIQEVPSNNNAVIDIRYEFDILDKIPPVVSFSPNGGCYGGAQVVRVTGYDEHFNHMDIEVYKSGEKIETKTISYPNNSYDISLNEYTEYIIYVKAYDDTGNVQTIGPQDERGYTYQKYLIEEDNGYLYDKVKTCSVSDANVDFSKQPTNEEAKQAYYLDNKPIYYYRGPVENNNVIFAGYCWKIVRTTETGGIKLIYSGTPTSDGKCTATGEEQFAFKSYFFLGNSSDYMYGDDDNPYENKYDSAIKKNLDAWYDGTLKTDDEGYPEDSWDHGDITKTYPGIKKYEDFLEDTVWCNDRSSDESPSSGGEMKYAAFKRLFSNNPIVTCPRIIDSFTTDTKNGNGNLKYPVGMITADEALMAGLTTEWYENNNNNNYLTVGSDYDYLPYWTMTPSEIAIIGDVPQKVLFYVRYQYIMLQGSESNSVRPMIALQNSVEIETTGNGTTENPYVVITDGNASGKKLYDTMISSAKEIVSDANVDFSQQPTNADANRLYYVDEGYPIYYYRGPVTNNNVIFGEYCWKIVRTTETGGIKLLYSGKPTSDGKCTATGEEQFAFKSKFNSTTNNKKYVGYMYGDDDNPYENKYPSTIKKNIEAWFDGTLKTDENGYTEDYPYHGDLTKTYPDLTQYEESYLEDAVWCNDRTEGSVEGNSMNYAVSDRNAGSSYSPSLVCPSNDSFTKSIENGNGELDHKIGLITADELVMGGLNGHTYSSIINTYLYAGVSSARWWSLSPSFLRYSYALVYSVGALLDAMSGGVDNSFGVRPMVSLQHEVKVIGSGTNDDPYKVVEEYSENILNGADPELGSGMIPVTIDNNGTVKYANVQEKWYSYRDKEWANAVILVDKPSKSYSIGDVIKESDIESYFVWIPRYRYQLWDLGDYTGYIDGQPDKSNARTIQIKFETIGNETKNGVTGECSTPLESGDKGSCNIGDWMTHPAFINMNTNGLWVGKFETGYNQNSDTTTPITDTSGWTTSDAEKDEENKDKIIVKPNVYSWRSISVGKAFKSAYNYERNLDSHMMKNTEWGAVAYLSHSDYGIGKEVNINNNSQFKTGYSTTQNADQSSYPGTGGTSADATQVYNTDTGHLASTTGNITGVYDMSGGNWEYVAGYMDGHGQDNSGLTEAELSTTYFKYFDKYKSDSWWLSYSNRILGDATGEVGPFYNYTDRDGDTRVHNSWYADSSDFAASTTSWFDRGGHWQIGCFSGQFNFSFDTGDANIDRGFRLVLAVR